ncbi:MAG: DUF1640 domain-containing protein [Betaproteobacteria bacterium]|nr:DUF1640 domain-containing protein [Betaproteobacteria bacterium]
MSSITFDTLKFVKHLEAAGLPPPQAEAIAEAFRDAAGEELVTRGFLSAELLQMENRLIKWGIGLALGQTAVIAALVKLL